MLKETFLDFFSASGSDVGNEAGKGSAGSGRGSAKWGAERRRCTDILSGIISADGGAGFSVTVCALNT